MGVLIRDMEIPQNCKRCPLRYTNTGYTFCELTGENLAIETDKRDDACPLVEVPPHGRLIDKDKLRRELFLNFNGERIPFYDCDNFPTTLTYRDLHSILAEQPTIIEAEWSNI